MRDTDELLIELMTGHPTLTAGEARSEWSALTAGGDPWHLSALYDRVQDDAVALRIVANPRGRWVVQVQ